MANVLENLPEILPLTFSQRTAFEIRTELAAIHHNFNLHAEEQGFREIENETAQFSRVVQGLVVKRKKTLVMCDWMRHIIDSVQKADRIQIGDDAEDENDRTQPNNNPFEDSLEEWLSPDELEDDTDDEEILF